MAQSAPWLQILLMARVKNPTLSSKTGKPVPSEKEIIEQGKHIQFKHSNADWISN